MSRCLPFPPPGYVWNGVTGEALLELIKVQKERVKAEKQKKKEKRRKKESEQGEISKKKRGHHKRHKGLRSNEDEGSSENRGKSEHETQELEKSSLSEELELEQPKPDSLYASSDNSQSIRRKRNIIVSCNECHNYGMMDSIVVQKKLELPVENQFSSASAMHASDVQGFVPPPLMELCRSCRRAGLNMDKKSEMNRIESQFRELVVNWIPPPLQIEQFDVDDHQEWLFESKPTRSDIYALPYTMLY
ncbi:hypothetical protein PTKIN_Ptkin10aG0162300 [Pterospermum kingtungense]